MFMACIHERGDTTIRSNYINFSWSKLQNMTAYIMALKYAGTLRELHQRLLDRGLVLCEPPAAASTTQRLVV
jgi:hypothetical protein